MKTFLLAVMLFATLFSQMCQAQFQLTGPIILTLTDHCKENTEFGFAFLQHEGAFQFGFV